MKPGELLPTAGPTGPGVPAKFAGLVGMLTGAESGAGAGVGAAGAGVFDGFAGAGAAGAAIVEEAVPYWLRTV